ncbi:MAG: hypothetical protein KBS98_00360 [Flavobacterium sp.]|nr:hypothetical protein [Candidatus Neoflavobacterium equi]
MKHFILTALAVMSTAVGSLHAQDLDNDAVNPDLYTAHNKGKFYISWGGNRAKYSKSDITFTGEGHEFTLHDVPAHDKPKGWHIDYLNPTRMTIPQTNLRVGYFLTDKYNISVGVDHMKYVMYQDRAVDLTGTYPNMGSYDESLPNGQVNLTEKFLTFEHTDGLNYISADINRVDDISKLFTINNTDAIQVNTTYGVGGGVLYPKTNAQLLSMDRHDNFHISGFGVSAKAGLNVTFFKHFYVQVEAKGGYIDMNKIHVTEDDSWMAKQHFFFVELPIVFGTIFRF